MTVELSGGGTTTAALMTYTLLYNPATARVNGTTTNQTVQIGWRDDRVMIDTHYLINPFEKDSRTEFKDSALQLQNIGYINFDGTKRAIQTGPPDSIQFDTYETINFGSFLQL